MLSLPTQAPSQISVKYPNRDKYHWEQVNHNRGNQSIPIIAERLLTRLGWSELR